MGRAMIHELLADEPLLDASLIRIFDLHEPAEPPADTRVQFVRGDVRDPTALADAMTGIDAVFHLASMVDWGTHKPSTVYDVNVGGVAKALEAARSAGVSVFVYTSSLDAVITGRPLRDVDESLPYPRVAPNAYCGSKAEAEKAVAAADDAARPFRTVNLRPASVWGEADPYHISALVNLARKGPYVRIGDGSAVQQHIYAGNLAHGHLAACREMLEAVDEGREPRCAGRSYFLTDAPPINFFRFFDEVVRGSGFEIRPENLWIPRPLMLGAGIVAESLAWLLRPLVHWNPKVSRFAVNYTCSDFTFTSAAARRDFGFAPKYDQQTAFARTTSWFRDRGPAAVPPIPAEPLLAG